VRYWDSSALLPLIVEEPRSRVCRELWRSDRAIVTWALSRTEIASALQRLCREGKLSRARIASAMSRLDSRWGTWAEVDGLVAVRDRAERLLAAHTLTAADAHQLAAALVVARDRPRHRAFVTADEALAAAARAEGFDVLDL
jgi:predicted nucleic acid-binding protein